MFALIPENTTDFQNQQFFRVRTNNLRECNAFTNKDLTAACL